MSRLRPWIAGALVAFVGAACTIPAARPGDLDTNPEAHTLRPGYVAPTPASVERDVPYGPGPAQLVDVYHPHHPRPTTPVILYLHAGGWVSGDKDPVPPVVLRQGARMGATVVSAGYTLSDATDPATAFPAAPRDVDRAIRWAKRNAPTWGNASRVVVIGASAGGNLALLAALAPGRFVDDTLPPELAVVSPRVSGVVSLAGPVDIPAMWAIEGWRRAALVAYLGCDDCPPGHVAAANPLTYLGSAPVPPAYLAYGVWDWLIPPDVHGLPTAIHMMLARGDQHRSNVDRGIWWELVDDDHALGTNLNVRYLETWLDFVAEGRWGS